jgi:hypothetical protein
MYILRIGTGEEGEWWKKEVERGRGVGGMNRKGGKEESRKSKGGWKKGKRKEKGRKEGRVVRR